LRLWWKCTASIDTATDHINCSEIYLEKRGDEKRNKGKIQQRRKHKKETQVVLIGKHNEAWSE
jgi:hypothetical protein